MSQIQIRYRARCFSVFTDTVSDSALCFSVTTGLHLDLATQRSTVRALRAEGTTIRVKDNQTLGTNFLKMPAWSQMNNGLRTRKTNLANKLNWLKTWQFGHTWCPICLSWNFLAKMKSQSSYIQDEEESKALGSIIIHSTFYSLTKYL